MEKLTDKQKAIFAQLDSLYYTAKYCGADHISMLSLDDEITTLHELTERESDALCADWFVASLTPDSPYYKEDTLTFITPF